jgi:signal peptidase
VLRLSLLAIVIGWFMTLRPVLLGGPASYILVGGQSMEPTLHAGSLVVAFNADHYEVGDIVVYRVPGDGVAAGRQVIHRIVGSSSDAEFVLQGDNAASTDLWRPTEADVLGKAAFVIPSLADFIVFLRSPVVIASLAAAIAAFAVLSLSFPAPSREDRLLTLN